MAVASAGHKSFAPCSRQITMPVPHQSVFTGQMPLLPPNQQHQSTEGTQIEKRKNLQNFNKLKQEHDVSNKWPASLARSWSTSWLRGTQALQHHHSSAAFTHSTPNTLLLTFFAQTICSPITFLVGQMASFVSWAVAATYLTKTNHRNESLLLHKSVQNLTVLSNRVSIPIEMVLVSCSELVDRVLEDLSTVDLLFQSSTCDEAIDNHIHRLADAKSSVDRLWVSCWVPAWVNYSQSQHPTHASHNSLLLPCCKNTNWIRTAGFLSCSSTYMELTTIWH